MTNTYTATRANYYQNNKEEIKRKRREIYKENIIAERNSALDRHYTNKDRNNKKSLEYYHKNSKELNIKRAQNRIIDI